MDDIATGYHHVFSEPNSLEYFVGEMSIGSETNDELFKLSGGGEAPAKEESYRVLEGGVLRQVVDVVAPEKGFAPSAVYEAGFLPVDVHTTKAPLEGDLLFYHHPLSSLTRSPRPVGGQSKEGNAVAASLP